MAIALPPQSQAQLAVKAARAGRRLLLDKPLAATVADARAVAEAVEEAGVASVVFFTLRFDAGTAEWIARQAAAGEWFTGRADWYGAVFSGDASPYADSPWRREKGGLWDVGPHALSVLLPVLGDATEVHAARGPGDLVHLTLRHDSGASSTAVLTLTAPPAGVGRRDRVPRGARRGRVPGRHERPGDRRDGARHRRAGRGRTARVRRAVRTAGHRDPGRRAGRAALAP